MLVLQVTSTERTNSQVDGNVVNVDAWKGCLEKSLRMPFQLLREVDTLIPLFESP